MVKNREYWQGPGSLFCVWLLGLAAADGIKLFSGWARGAGDPPGDPLRDFLDKGFYGGKIECSACLALADRLQELIPSVSAKKLDKALSRLPARNCWRRDCRIIPAEQEAFTQTLRDCTVRFIGALRAAAEHGDSIELN